MKKKELKETINRWAEYIIPTVFKGETDLLEKHPEWRDRLKDVPDDERTAVAEQYCRAIAETIVEGANNG